MSILSYTLLDQWFSIRVIVWVAAFLAVLMPLARADDLFPLRRGYYVSVDVPCAGASNATLNLFDGAKLGGAHQEVLKTAVKRKADGSYQVTEEWLDLQGGERAKPQRRSFNLQVFGTTEFVIRGKPRDYRARYCPQSELPYPWATIDLRDRGID